MATLSAFHTLFMPKVVLKRGILNAGRPAKTSNEILSCWIPQNNALRVTANTDQEHFHLPGDKLLSCNNMKGWHYSVSRRMCWSHNFGLFETIKLVDLFTYSSIYLFFSLDRRSQSHTARLGAICQLSRSHEKKSINLLSFSL